MRISLLASAALLLASGASAQEWCTPRRADSGYVALTGLTVWDGSGAPARPRTTVLLHGERIAGVFPDGVQALPSGTAVHQLNGKFAIPGLIDSHVHVGSDVSGEDSRVRADRRLCRALLGGITAVRDMAGDTRALGSMQRDATVGDIASPDIYFASLWAGPAFFADPRTAQASAGEVPGSMPGMRSIDSTTDLRQAVAEARGTGATAIKLYAALSPALVAAATAEAHRQGLEVWAHAAMAAVTPLQMTSGGVDVISHAALIARQLGPEAYGALVTDSTPGERPRPAVRLAARAATGGATFVSHSEATMNMNGQESKATVVSTWVLKVQGDSLSGTVARTIEGFDMAGGDQPPQPVTGSRKKG